MKKIDFKNKKTTWWLIGLLIVIILLILFFKGLNGKPLFNSKNNNNLVDIANSKEYTKYNGVAKANFEGESLLDFSFLHRNEIKIVQGSGDQARWYKLIDASSTNNVTLYFTYEGGRGYSIDDYIDNVLKTNNASITVEQVKFTDEDSPIVKRIIDNDTNTEYYIEAITSNDGSSWLAIVENLKADDEYNQNVAKDLIRSLEVNSQDEVKAEVDEATTTATTTEEVATTSIINA